MKKDTSSSACNSGTAHSIVRYTQAFLWGAAEVFCVYFPFYNRVVKRLVRKGCDLIKLMISADSWRTFLNGSVFPPSMVLNDNERMVWCHYLFFFFLNISLWCGWHYFIYETILVFQFVLVSGVQLQILFYYRLLWDNWI